MTTINSVRAAELLGLSKQGMVYTLTRKHLTANRRLTDGGTTRYELRLADVLDYAKSRVQEAQAELAQRVEAVARIECVISQAA